MKKKRSDTSSKSTVYDYIDMSQSLDSAAATASLSTRFIHTHWHESVTRQDCSYGLIEYSLHTHSFNIINRRSKCRTHHCHQLVWKWKKYKAQRLLVGRLHKAKDCKVIHNAGEVQFWSQSLEALFCTVLTTAFHRPCTTSTVGTTWILWSCWDHCDINNPSEWLPIIVGESCNSAYSGHEPYQRSTNAQCGLGKKIVKGCRKSGTTLTA